MLIGELPETLACHHPVRPLVSFDMSRFHSVLDGV
jgi:hypothetical protein